MPSAAVQRGEDPDSSTASICAAIQQHPARRLQQAIVEKSFKSIRAVQEQEKGKWVTGKRFSTSKEYRSEGLLELQCTTLGVVLSKSLNPVIFH